MEETNRIENVVFRREVIMKEDFKEPKGTLSLRSSFSYGASVASNVYFLIFGVTFKFLPLMIFQFFVCAITIYFIFKFVFTRRKMLFETNLIVKETIGLCMPILISIIISVFTVKMEFDGGELSSIANENLLIGFLNLILIGIFTTRSARNTKRWYNGTNTSSTTA